MVGAVTEHSDGTWSKVNVEHTGNETMKQKLIVSQFP